MPRPATDPDAEAHRNALTRSVDLAAATHIKTLARHAARVADAPIRPGPDIIERAMDGAAVENASDTIHCPVAEFEKRVVDALRHLSPSVRELCPDEVAALERHAARLVRS